MLDLLQLNKFSFYLILLQFLYNLLIRFDYFINTILI